MRGGYFCSAGYTETGGMDRFLRKLAPQVDWQRCFPAVSKPAPKLGRSMAQPAERHAGRTGQALVEEMLKRLEQHFRGTACSLDLVLLIDDADCRFADAADPAGAQHEWEARLSERVRIVTAKPDLGFHALLAWPEIEAWLITDWEHGFGAQYRGVAPPLRQHVASCILAPLSWAQVESYGGGLKDGSCQHKLSHHLQETFIDAGNCRCRPAFIEHVKRNSPSMPLSYSKRLDGAAMLQRIEPARVAQECSGFRGALTRIRETAERTHA